MKNTRFIEYRPSKLSSFFRALLWGLGAAASWQVLHQWMGWGLLSASVGLLCVIYGVKALVHAFVFSQFRTVRIGDDWILGPGRESGVQLTVPRAQIVNLKQTRESLVLTTDAGESIVIYLFDHGSQADELVRRIRIWLGKPAAA